MRENTNDLNALEDARGNERLEETMEDDDDDDESDYNAKNAFEEHHNARDDDVMYGDEEEEEYISRAPNALVIAPTSSRDCGVTASLLFARCARECVCEDEDEEEEQDQEGERENAFVENEDINENSARRESLRRKEKDSGASGCLLYTSPSPRDLSTSRMPSSA